MQVNVRMSKQKKEQIEDCICHADSGPIAAFSKAFMDGDPCTGYTQLNCCNAHCMVFTFYLEAVAFPSLPYCVIALSDTQEPARGRVSNILRKGYISSGLNLCTMLMEEEGSFQGKLQIKQVQQNVFFCDLHNLKILKSVFLSHPHNKVLQSPTVETFIILCIILLSVM